MSHPFLADEDTDRIERVTPDATAAPADDDTPPDAAGIDVNLLRRYRTLRDAEKAADAEMKAFKEEADAIQQQLIDAFTDAGIQNISVDGKTIYLHRSTFAQRKPDVTTEDVKAALRAAGADELITETVNANTLNAFIRELVENAEDGGAPVPEAINDVLELGERYTVRINAAGSRAKSKTKSK